MKPSLNRSLAASVAAVLALALKTIAGALKPEHREKARETLKP